MSRLSRFLVALLVAGTSLACDNHEGLPPGGGKLTGTDAGANDRADTGVPFMRPDYTPQPGNCGFDMPAFSGQMLVDDDLAQIISYVRSLPVESP